MIHTSTFLVLVTLLETTDQAVHAAANPSGLGAAAHGLVQLFVGLSIAAFAINQGLQIVSKMLEGIDIWAEVKKKTWPWRCSPQAWS